MPVAEGIPPYHYRILVGLDLNGAFLRRDQEDGSPVLGENRRYRLPQRSSLSAVWARVVLGCWRGGVVPSALLRRHIDPWILKLARPKKINMRTDSLLAVSLTQP